MPVLSEDEHPMPWDLFERHANQYERWYATPRGQRVDSAERILVKWLLQLFPDAQSVLEVGCGTLRR
jgi:ubiquinone/menaquinone biosynthesis C-methylase UbiE